MKISTKISCDPKNSLCTMNMSARWGKMAWRLLTLAIEGGGTVWDCPNHAYIINGQPLRWWSWLSNWSFIFLNLDSDWLILIASPKFWYNLQMPYTVRMNMLYITLWINLFLKHLIYVVEKTIPYHIYLNRYQTCIMVWVHPCCLKYFSCLVK